MASIEELVIKLSADNRDLKAKLADSQKSVGKFGGAVSKLGPMIAGAFAVGSIVAFGKAAFDAFEQQEQANRRLMFAVKGNKEAYEQLTEQATLLQSKTGVDEESIQQVQMLAVSAGQSTAATKQLVTASMALSAATGMDLQSSYMQLSGTLNGVAGKSIPKLGTEFANLSVEQLKSGDAVRLLNEKYGELAEKSATATSLLKANWGELMETIGGGISKVVTPALEYLNVLFMSSDDKKKQGYNVFGIKQRMTWDQVKAARGKESMAAAAADTEFIGGIKPDADALDKTREPDADALDKAREAAAAWEKYMAKIHEADKIMKDNDDGGAWVLSMLDFGQGVQSKTGKGITNPKTQGRTLTKRTGESGMAGAIKLSNDQLEKQISLLNASSTLMAGLGSIAQASFGEQSAAYKAFAIAQAIISTYLAATQALAAPPVGYGPVAGPFAAAGIIAMGVANIGQIAGAFAQGGIVGGTSFAGDNINARVNSGEMILNGSQQAQLFAMANGGGGGRTQIYGKLRAGDIYLSNKRGAYMKTRRG